MSRAARDAVPDDARDKSDDNRFDILVLFLWATILLWLMRYL